MEESAATPRQADSEVYYYERSDDDDGDDRQQKAVQVEDADGNVVDTTTLGGMVDSYVSWCNESLGMAPYIQVEHGNGGLPVVHLRHPNGSEAQVYLHGACVTSVTKPGGTELLHVRPGNRWDGVAPLAGGITVAFPQYRRGLLPADGFLRFQHWSLVDAYIGAPDAEDPAPTVVLYSESDDSTRELWPFEFEAFYTVSLGLEDEFPDVEVDEQEQQQRRWAQQNPDEDPDYDEGILEPEAEDEDRSTPPLQLSCTLQIRNTDTRPFEFCAALGTSYATADLAGPMGSMVRTLGLGGKYMLDWSVDPTGNQPVLRVEDQDYLNFGEHRVDRLYVDADADKGDVLFCPGDRSHIKLINRQGFKDIGAWHPPGAQEDDGTNRFVSLPSARAARPVKLYPGEVWTGEMVIRAYDYYWETPLWDRGMQPMPPRKGTRL